MDVDQALPRNAISSFEIESAHETRVAVMFDAALSGDRVSLVSVYDDLLGRAFVKGVTTRQFVCVHNLHESGCRIESPPVGADAALVSLNARACLRFRKTGENLAGCGIAVSAALQGGRQLLRIGTGGEPAAVCTRGALVPPGSGLGCRKLLQQGPRRLVTVITLETRQCDPLANYSRP